MSEQTSQSFTAPQRPSRNDGEAWPRYWRQLGQPWRTEPEIDDERREELKKYRATVPDIEKDIYSFRDVKLNRTDIEWLLASNDDEEALDVRGADLRQANLRGLPLEGVNLNQAHLEGANLSKAQLGGANLREAHMEGANLHRANLGGAKNPPWTGAPADLRRAIFDSTTNLEEVILNVPIRRIGILFYYSATLLADVHWGGVNLAVVDWKQLNNVGDEVRAYQTKSLRERVIRVAQFDEGWFKFTDDQEDQVDQAKRQRNAQNPATYPDKGLAYQVMSYENRDLVTLLNEYRAAVRANRQLATVLQAQGLNEEAAHFAYRAQLLQRRVLWKRIHLPLVLQQGVWGQGPSQRGSGKAVWPYDLELRSYGQKPEEWTPTSDLWKFYLGLSLKSLQLPGSIALGLLRRVPLQRLKLVRQGSVVLAPLFILLLLLQPLWLGILLWLMPPTWQSVNPVVVFLAKLLVGEFALLIGGQILPLWQHIQTERRLSRERGHETSFYERPKTVSSVPREVSDRETEQVWWWIALMFEAVEGYGQYFLSLFLDLLAGYGYRPVRALFWYLVVISGFATAYFTFGHLPHFLDALVFSVASFHGRGFFPSLGDGNHPLTLHDTLVVLASIEAIVGLIIEISFIATFTQRFFGK